jgi:hypothetical protein
MKNEIILYRPNELAEHIEVRFDEETVWLTQQQMSSLFMRDQSVISRHINNIFKENELDEKSNMQILHITNIDRPVSFYNLDVIISVGYRVKSKEGVLFRQWATRVLKDYLLKGYAINQRFERLEYRVHEHDKQLETLVQQALPPKQGVFYEGQIFDAYIFVSNLIKSAKKSIVLIDNYVDESVLLLLSKRKKSVSAKILTANHTKVLQQDLQKHNVQYPPIEIEKYTKSHDRFLIIDNQTYLIGASLKDLGKKLFGFSKMDLNLGL